MKIFDYIKIKLASPSKILQWGSRRLPNGQMVGEVRLSQTLNYKSGVSIMNGLFCERIFGPTKDFQCFCGKYKHIRSEGLICDSCGVELTTASVRRHRFGHIPLNYPVAHIWYFHHRPNFLALLLEVEGHEKTVNTGCIAFSSADRGKLMSSTEIKLWDERIQRIKLSTFAYFLFDNRVELYGLHWDLQQYRRNREQGKSYYPLKPDPKPKDRNPILPRYLRLSTPDFLMGVPLIRKELEELDLPLEIKKTREFILLLTKVLERESPEYDESNWFRKWEQERMYKLRKEAIQRLRLLGNLVATGCSPAWMILTVVPVIPPTLRPVVPLESGGYASADLNDLYRSVIQRNSRVLALSRSIVPQQSINIAKRILQESVDQLIDNGKRGSLALSTNKRPLKSLSEIIRGKEGRFRLNLLGKRVDYSGRSVIVVGPDLKLHQCGLPYEMAIELFQPFLIRELIQRNLANTVILAQILIKEDPDLSHQLLKKILKRHPIFLNRAPTLHRLGIQAFEAIVVPGRAIQLHPLVCSGFNADFDGDQMAVHIPLSLQAQSECYNLMLATYNFLSPANGEPIIVPSQDMVLGCYYLTTNNMKGLLGSNHYFANLEDAILAYHQNQIEIHSTIWIRLNSENFALPEDSETTAGVQTVALKDDTILEYRKHRQSRKTKTGETLVEYVQTTTGRAIFNRIIQKTLSIS